ncbi:unnamed protein product [Scytosiphon promiscuus]
MATTKRPPKIKGLARKQKKASKLWKSIPVGVVVVAIAVAFLWDRLAPSKEAASDAKAGSAGPNATSAAAETAAATAAAAAAAAKKQKPLSRSLHAVDVEGPGCGAHSYLSPTHVVPGFHLACVEERKVPRDGASDDGTVVSVTLFQDGQGAGNQTLTLPTALREEGEGADAGRSANGADFLFRAELAERLKLDEVGKDPPNKFPWAMYTPDGQRRISSLKDAITSRLVFIFKGGNFIWPGVEVGHVQTVQGLETLGSIDMKTLSMEPLVFEAKNFLLDDECQHIREKAEPHMKPSPVSLMDHDKGKPDTNWRTSTTYFMPSTRDPLLQGIDRRVEEFTRVPKSHQEQVQVLKYDKGQRYTAHHDFFNPKMYQKDERTLKNMDGGRKNRMVTVFWYLSNVEEGGETVFPRYGGFKGRVDFSDCTKGLKVKPAEGKVAMFYSLRPDGQFDDFSLHGACPVIAGQKWAANKWVWSAPVHFGA